MKIAHIPIPPDLHIPKLVLQIAKKPQVDTSIKKVPLGAELWIACCYAMPHVDEEFAGELFLILSVISHHEIGDAHSISPNMSAGQGSLFVVDPMVCHWLVNIDSWDTTKTKPWIGVEWMVKKKDGKKKAHEIVKNLGGKWLGCEDKRYTNWRE